MCKRKVRVQMSTTNEDKMATSSSPLPNVSVYGSSPLTM